MPYTAAGKNLMLAALAGTNPTTPITHVAAYNGDPSGAGSQVGSRVSTSFGVPSSGSMGSAAGVEITMAAGTSANYVAYFSAATAGTLLAYDDIPQETFASEGVLHITGSTLNLNL